MIHLRKLLIGLYATSLGLSAPAFGGEIFAPVKGDALTSLLTKHTMVSEYNGTNDSGAAHFTERHNMDGTTNYKVVGKPMETGRWSIIGGDKACYRYPDSDDHPGPYCFFIYEREGCYYSFYARVMGLKGPRSWNDWSYRAVQKGSGGTCGSPVG